MTYTQKVRWGSVAVTLDSLSIWDRIFLGASIAAILVLSFPHLAIAQTSGPLMFKVDPEHLRIYLAQEKDRTLSIAADPQELGELEIIVIPALDPRAQKLREYLENKNSPMTPYAEDLLHQYHYRLIIGISFAESNFCKKNIRPHNCWGIGGGYPETYQDYPAAFERADQLIQKYRDNGMTTPKLMRNTWVGWKNDSWIVAVNQVLSQLEELGL